MPMRTSSFTDLCALAHGRLKWGVQKADQIRPVTFTAPIKLSMEFNRSEDADITATLAGVRRTDAYTVEATAKDFFEIHQAAWNMFEMSMLGPNANK